MLLHLLKVIIAARIAHFLPIWFTMTCGLAWAAVAFVCAVPAPAVAGPVEAKTAGRTVRDRAETPLVLLLLTIILTLCVYVDVRGEQFTYSDNSMFTLYTLRGRDLPPPIWRAQGRFFPLGHQEYNVVRRATSSVAGYHTPAFLELIAVCVIVLLLTSEPGLRVGALSAAVLLTAPAIVISFGGLIYDERAMVFWLACVFLSIVRWQQTQSPFWIAAAIFASQILLYTKETSWLLLAGLAIGGLFFRDSVSSPVGWGSAREDRFRLCLAALPAIYLLYYASIMFPHFTLRYAHEMQRPAGEVLADYATLDWLAVALAATAITRWVLIWRGRIQPWQLWDAAALGALLFWGAYLFLHMFASYYLAPVDLVAVLYLGRVVGMSWKRLSGPARCAVAILVCFVVAQNLTFSSVRLFERKNVIEGKALVAQSIRTYLATPPERPVVLYFPSTTPYHIMEFGSYLSYDGVPVEGVSASVRPLVLLVSPRIPGEGPCVSYAPVMCHAASSPDRNDLVITLPDDDPMSDGKDLSRTEGELLFSYEPHPRLSPRLFSLVKRLHIVSYAFADKEPPNSWLTATVSLWK